MELFCCRMYCLVTFATRSSSPAPASTLILLEYSFLSFSQSLLCALLLSPVPIPRILGTGQLMLEDG